jgi:hypothetical protein
MPKQIKSYLDFRGGLNLDAAPDNLADNELMEANNCILDERGALSKRKGTIPLNETSYGAEVERLIEWPLRDGDKVLLAIVGSTLCKINSDYTKTDLKVLDDAEIGYFFYADKFYFTGKESTVDKYWQYDGTTVSEVTPNADPTNDLAPIKRCRLFLWHAKSQRIFAAKDASDRAALYYSEAGDPTFFKETSKLYPTTGDGPVYSLSLFGEAMATIYQSSVWTWKGVSPDTDAEWMKIPSEYGTLSSRTPKLTPNSLTFLGQGGLISLSPGLIDSNVVMLTGDELIKNRTKDKVSSVIRSITNSEITCAIYDRITDKYMLAYTDVASATRNSKVLVLDWGLQSFTIFTGWQVNDFLQRTNGDILIATNGYILKAGEGYKDWDGTTEKYKAINFSIKTKQWNLDYPVHIKKTRRLFLAARQYAVTNTTLDIQVDAGYGQVSYPDVPIDDSFVWGDVWGTTWGWADLVTKEMRCKQKGTRFCVTISNDAIDELVTIYGLAFEYKVKKPRGEKV